MSECTELLQKLNTKLGEFEYTSESEISIPNVKFIAYIPRKNVFKVKNLCAVVDMPGNISDLLTAKNFFEFLKKSLLSKYGDAFLWKELEMSFVVLCDLALYELLKLDGGKIMNQASFSLNALTGSCFVNKQNYENFLYSTWGLFFAGDQFKAVSNTVEQWCSSKTVKSGENTV